MKIWNPFSSGDSYAVDYTVAGDFEVKAKTLAFSASGAASIEAEVIRQLAEYHGVDRTEIGVIHVIRVHDFKGK